MRKLKNKSAKGKKIEKEFSLVLKNIFPSADTEIKPRIINMRKDFWGLFDGLTFIHKKKKFIFWQIKSKKITSSEYKKFWSMAYKFNNHNVVVLLIEKIGNSYKIYFDRNKNFFDDPKDIKNFFRKF